VRRRAPAGSRFADSDRASGVFGVIATGYSVLLGFLIFLAFTAYDESRQAAEQEAVLVAQQVETAQFLPETVSADLTGELICYARSVVGVEWDALQDQTLADDLNPWAEALYRTIRDVEPTTNAEQSAYDRWMDLTLDREQARRDRIHVASGLIPSPLWVVLVAVSLVVVTYLLFMADPDELAVSQALMAGGVMAVITLLLLLLAFFNRPYQDGIGGLEPTSMERTLRVLDEVVAEGLIEVDAPCDAEGRSR
jgi:hypothetical protein